MGWFLRPKTSGGGTKRSGKGGGADSRGRGKADPLAPRWSPQRTMLAIKIVGIVVGVATVIAGWQYGQGALREYARTHHAAPITAADVVIHEPPAWIPVDLELETRRLVAGQIGDDPVDNTTLRAAAAALGEWAWIEPGGVHQITRRSDGTVVIEVTFRSPLAVIRARDGYHLVSEAGVRLPALYTRAQVSRMNVPVLIGVESPPPPEGRSWPGRDVEAGLTLARFLVDEPFMEEVTAIDVSGRDGRGRLRLALETGTGKVLWGLPPGDERSVEPDARTKLHRLRQVAATRGSIDAGGRVVHLYGATVQVSRPEAERGGEAPQFGGFSGGR